MKRFPETLFILTALLGFSYIAIQHSWWLPLRTASIPLRPSMATSTARPTDVPIPTPDTGVQFGPVPDASPKTDTPPAASAAAIQTEAFEAGRRAALQEIQIQKQQDNLKNYVMVVITLILLLCGVAVIMMERYDANQKHWSYATLGTIVGFWLR